ncbi:MAG: HEAT repeat domain-containing protein [Planctomycetota bacterium]|jgi:hypothetical protein
MTVDSSAPLLLAGLTREALTAKFGAGMPPRLAVMWDHFLILARNNPYWFSPYAILAWMVTGEEPYREVAREHFLSLTREKDAGMVTNEVQNHTHTATAPLVHTLIHYDWIYGTGLLSPEEEEAFAEAMLDLASQTSMTHLQGRARSFDNQVFSAAISAAVVGFVLGRRHGAHGRARRLYARGYEWTLDQLSRLTADCYSLEGSTYHELIVLPLITLAAAFVEEVDGTQAYALGVRGGTPVRDWLVAFERMIGESGLLPGWDQYGIMRASCKLPLAYRSHRDGCGEPLTKIIASDMWYPLCHSMWEMSDRLWTLVWWEDDLVASEEYRQRDWIVPRTGGAVHVGSSRLFQYWDEAAPAPHTGRPQLNPNAIQFDCAGLPLLLDGEPAPSQETLNWNEKAMREYLGDPMLKALAKSWRMELTEERVHRQIERAIGGNLGASNSLVIDGEDWFVPLNAVRGEGRALHGAGNVRLIESDAAAMYVDRYDLTRCARTSVLIGESVLLCIDRVEAKTPHNFTWQAFTWPDAMLRDGGATASAMGAVRLDLMGPAGAAWAMDPIADFPRWPAKGSTRLRMQHGGESQALTIPVCMTAQRTAEMGWDLSAGWSHSANDGEGETVDLNTFYLSDDTGTGTVHRFEREVECSAAELKAGVILRVAAIGPTTQLFVGDEEVRPLVEQDSAEVAGRSFNIPSVYDLSGILREGVNHLRIETIGFHGETVMGPVQLQSKCGAEEPQFNAVSETDFEITTPAGVDRVLLGGESPVPLCGGSFRAVAAVQKADGEVALLGVERADLPEVSLRVSATRSIDLSVKDDQLVLGAMGAGRSAVVEYGGARIRFDTVAGLVVSAVAPTPLTLILEGVVKGCVVNGEFVAGKGGVAEVKLVPASSEEPSETLTPELLYRYGEAPDLSLESVVMAALRSMDWRVRAAGADLAGAFRLGETVPELLYLFEKEGQEGQLGYGAHWVRSKMNSAIADGVDHSPNPDLDPVKDAKGGRLRQSVIIALGLIGDTRACAPLREAMAEAKDHFLTLSQVPVALARLDDEEAIPVLQAQSDFFEVNVMKYVGRALDYLEGRTTRDQFESEVNA